MPTPEHEVQRKSTEHFVTFKCAQIVYTNLQRPEKPKLTIPSQ